MIDIDPDTLGDVVGIYLIPAGPAQQPCLALRVIAGPKAYARVWLDRLDTVEWGWVLPSGAVRLWSDGRLDDTDERADAPPSGRGAWEWRQASGGWTPPNGTLATFHAYDRRDAAACHPTHKLQASAAEPNKQSDYCPDCAVVVVARPAGRPEGA